MGIGCKRTRTAVSRATENILTEDAHALEKEVVLRGGTLRRPGLDGPYAKTKIKADRGRTPKVPAALKLKAGGSSHS